MKKPFTEQLLYIMAAMADYNRRSFSINLALAHDGDPRLYKYRRLLERSLKDKKKKQKFYESLYALRRGGFIEKNLEGYFLTEKGLLRAFRNRARESKFKKLAKGKYLMVFFDIPERKRRLRNQFRFLLIELGFEKVQRSVWITALDVADEVKKIIDEMLIKDYVKPLYVKEIG